MPRPTLAFGDALVPDPDDPRLTLWRWLHMLLGYAPHKGRLHSAPLLRRFKHTWMISPSDWLRGELRALHDRPGTVEKVHLYVWRWRQPNSARDFFMGVPPDAHPQEHLDKLIATLNSRSHIRDQPGEIRGHWISNTISP